MNEQKPNDNWRRVEGAFYGSTLCALVIGVIGAVALRDMKAFLPSALVGGLLGMTLGWLVPRPFIVICELIACILP